MNLRNAARDNVNYNIGLDIGTGSVGWAVTDSNGELFRFKGKPTWGSRVYPSAEPASVARVNRGQRRRYDRRRQRLDLLQRLFCEPMQGVDPEFFIRLNQSRLLKEDRLPEHSDYRYPLFNDEDFDEVEYYEKYPTIYHLRKHLMESDKKEDLRLIYLALHNIVKARGNFLWQDNPDLSAKNADTNIAIDRMCAAVENLCIENDIIGAGVPDARQIREILSQQLSKREKQQKVQSALMLGTANRKMAKALSNAIFGYVVEFGDVFGEDKKSDASKFSLDNDDKTEEYRSLCPDEGVELFESLLMLRSAVILMDILDGGDGRTISYHKCDEYQRYGDDLKTLKALVRQYVPQKYDEVFRGAHYDDPRWQKDYDPDKVSGYTKYNLTRGQSYDVFKKYVNKLFSGTDAVEDPRYASMMAAFDEERFLRRLKTSDNGSIPYQLHLEEMHIILQRQGEFHPFLLNEMTKIESLVTFRIPYYVGPLTQKNAPVDSMGKTRFAWSERVEGAKGSEAIKPWNWDQIIDKDKSAEAFIRRMTGTCTYLYGEPVLPKASLLYERFCVLNELNGARYCIDGDKWHRFSFDERDMIVRELFERRRTVSYKAVADLLRKRNPGLNPQVRGGQGESGFESKLSSYCFFSKLLGVEDIYGSTADMVENIILWSTLFEDRTILRERIVKTYGKQGNGALTGEQIGKICKKRFTGWGKLSKKLLCDVRVKFDGRRLSIMDILVEGMPYGSHLGSAMVFMEILHDDEFGFQKKIDDINKSNADGRGGLSVDDMPGSPALRRSVNQALRIVAEIVSISGTAPTRIYIETTRDDDEKNKGKRTTRRYNQVENALKAFKAEGGLDQRLLTELKDYKGKEISDRIALYFLQNGKCMYSGKALDLRQISMYQIDHIIPQSYIKDDSLENKVLVLPSTNQSKSDSLLIDESIRKDRGPAWRALHHAGMMGDKKFGNLMRASISKQQMRGFVARQLVETSQVVKFVRMMLEETYPDTLVRSIRASLSHQLREAENYAKCRIANDYHHAHDALLASELGRFIEVRYGDMFDNPIGIEHAMRDYIRSLNDEKKKTGHMPRSASMIVGSFRRNYIDRDTGEVLWDGNAETERIRRYLNYKDCYISRMTEITSGTFWKQNAISPKKGNPPVLALKGNLDPSKYGGYTSEEYSNFFVMRCNKKGKESLVFSQMPVAVSAQIEDGDQSAFVEYANKMAAQLDAELVRIERVRIPKYQLIEIDGERFFITGKKEMRNARQLAFTQDETALLSIVESAVGTNPHFDDLRRLHALGDEQLILFYDSLLVKCESFAKRLSKQMKLEQLRAGFVAAGVEDKARTIAAIIVVCNAGNNRADLTQIGGSKRLGCMQPTYNKELNVGNGHFVFIDQSVTGMFEKRWQVEL